MPAASFLLRLAGLIVDRPGWVTAGGKMTAIVMLSAFLLMFFVSVPRR